MHGNQCNSNNQRPHILLRIQHECIYDERLATLVPNEDSKEKIVGDLIHPSDLVVLVVPIDKAAPKGRLILPQQQTIRDILESDAISVVVKENELANVNKQKYGWFSWYIMLTLWMTSLLFRTVFNGV